MDKLSVGDEVLWSGTWGLDKPRKVKVTAIERDCVNKEGTSVSSIPWEEVKGRGVIVDVHAPKRGRMKHWAYGFQIQPAEAS